MPQSKITLIGMEQYLNPEHSLFEELTLPEGIDKDTLIGAIILRCQEFELLYSNPEFMIQAIKVWGMKNYWTFDRWVKLINKEYDPLYNKDYHEEITDIHYGQFNKSGSGSSSGSSSESSDYTRTDDLANSSTDTHSEKAYNDSDYVGTTQDVASGTNTGTQRNAGQTSESVSNQSSNSESGSDNHTNTHTSHGYGNIGVTAAQTLFMKETEVAAWNMYEHMADLFASEFCLMIY